MELFRAHAYAVRPSRTVDAAAAPSGGAIQVTDQVRSVLLQAEGQTKLDGQTQVDFRMEPGTRTNQVRTLVMAYAFKTDEDADASAGALALRLAGAMDRRSDPCLFLITSAREAQRRRVTLWTFPRDDAFQFRRGQQVSLSVLTDVFSRTSSHRKAALWQGTENRAQFIGGRVFDSQANRADRSVADFWIARFLDCLFSIAADAGTRMLAKAVRATFESVDELEAREQLLGGISGVRVGPQRRWSLRSFADTYLTGDAKDKFLQSAPNAESLDAVFDVTRQVFDETISYRLFRLNSEVYVSAPFAEVGRSVELVQGHLRCEGDVVDERIRTRHP